MSSAAVETSHARNGDMKLEIVVIPVSDVDRAKGFYSGLGWRLDADFASPAGDFRVIQFTPPGSGCSIIFGKNVTAAAPGSAQVPDRLRPSRRPRGAPRPWRRGQRGVPRRRRRLRWHGRALPLWAAPGWRSRPGASQLPLVRLVPRSGRQRLAAPGDHRTIARTRGRRRHGFHLVDRACGRAPTRGGRARRAREADRPT
jgi:catechol 2,3-dioxygenase-like lactoylglutathione lyase family enzyme